MYHRLSYDFRLGIPDCQLLADSVEKVGLPELPAY